MSRTAEEDKQDPCLPSSWSESPDTRHLLRAKISFYSSEAQVSYEQLFQQRPLKGVRVLLVICTQIFISVHPRDVESELLFLSKDIWLNSHLQVIKYLPALSQFQSYSRYLEKWDLIPRAVPPKPFLSVCPLGKYGFWIFLLSVEKKKKLPSIWLFPNRMGTDKQN